LNIDEPLAVEVKAGASYTPYYYHADGLGSITGLSDATGTMVQTYSYDAFGNVTPSGSVSQPFRFTGREYDAETSMYFYRARYYDPVVGRFVTKDPIGFAGGDVNLFAYVSANPIIYRDSSGFWADSINDNFPTSPGFSQCAKDVMNNSVSALKAANKAYEDCLKICGDNVAKLGCIVNDGTKTLYNIYCKSSCFATYSKEWAAIHLRTFLGANSCYLLYQDAPSGGKEGTYRGTHK